jgi:hypothetical protein
MSLVLRKGADRALLTASLLSLVSCVGGGDGVVGPSRNRAPEIRSVIITPRVVPIGGTAAIQVDAIDPDGDRVFYRYSAEAGTVSIADPANPSQAVYTQSGVQRPSDEITVVVTDTRNASISAVQTVALQGNRPPVAQVAGGGSCHPPCSRTFTASATDPDGDPVAYAWSGCASGGAESVTCDIVSVGTIVATVVVSDGRGGVATVSANAEGTNRAPAVSGGLDLTVSAARFNVDVSDADGDALVCGWFGNCQCTGSHQSYNLDCSLPSSLATCFMRFACVDPFGAAGETTFRLVR